MFWDYIASPTKNAVWAAYAAQKIKIKKRRLQIEWKRRFAKCSRILLKKSAAKF